MSPIVKELQKYGYHAEHRYFIKSIDYRTTRGVFPRAWLRAKMYLLYPIYFTIRELRAPSDYCIICTNTFYTPLLSTYIKKPGRESIHLLYDLFPDALIASEKIKENGILARIITKIVDTTFKRSRANVILGKHLKQHITSRLPASRLNAVIPVGTDCSPFPDVSRCNTGISIVYCGNFGHLHDVLTIKSALGSPCVKNLPLQFSFIGVGVGMEELKSTLNSNPQVSFSSGLGAEDWVKTMSNAPIGLVTMKPGAETILLPSKTYSAMAAGQAILAICPKQSDLADLVNTHECGWIVEPDDPNSLIETLKSVSNDPNDVDQKRRNAQAAARDLYSARPVAKLWSNLFKTLDKQKCQLQS